MKTWVSLQQVGPQEGAPDTVSPNLLKFGKPEKKSSARKPPEVQEKHPRGKCWGQRHVLKDVKTKAESNKGCPLLKHIIRHWLPISKSLLAVVKVPANVLIKISNNKYFQMRLPSNTKMLLAQQVLLFWKLCITTLSLFSNHLYVRLVQDKCFKRIMFL